MEPTAELKQAVRNYRAGRAEAFTRLYEESSKYIYTCIYKVVGGNDNAQDAVCDIMQDTYVEISKNIAQLDNEDSFLSWAGTIATRKCYAWLKKNKKYVLLHEEDDTFENLADDDNIIPEEVMQSREKQRLIRWIIDTQLTEMQKLCIIAYYYNEQKQSEIAKELGIPENTVKTNLSRAKAKIKNGVLDLEKKQGTRLYSVAPLLLFLFKEDVSACTVPYAVAARAGSVLSVAEANGAASAAGAGGGKALFGKIAAVSLKVKIAAAIIGVGVTGSLIGGAVYRAEQEKRDVWAPEIEETDFDEEREFITDISEDTENEIVIEEEPPFEMALEETETTLTDEEKEALERLVSLALITDYSFANSMDGEFYQTNDLAVDMRLIDVVSLFSIPDASVADMYRDYAPPMEIEEDGFGFKRYFEVEDIQSYLKNVFNMEDADLSAYMENGKVVCSLITDPVFTDIHFGKVVAVSDGTYKIDGTAAVIEAASYLGPYPFSLTVTPNSESQFGYTMNSLYYGAEAGIHLEDDQCEAILQMVLAAEHACISHWQMTEDFDIVPGEMNVLSKYDFAAEGARFGWTGENREQIRIEELAELYDRVTGEELSREELDAKFEEMQAEDSHYLYKGTDYEDGIANLYVHLDAFYGSGIINRYDIEKDEYVYENRAISYRNSGEQISKGNNAERFFDGYIALSGVSCLYNVPFTIFLYEDESSPTGYKLHYIHYYISESPLSLIG